MGTSHAVTAPTRTSPTGGWPSRLSRSSPESCVWEHEYNHRRLHLALCGRTPAKRHAGLRISPAAGVLRSDW